MRLSYRRGIPRLARNASFSPTPAGLRLRSLPQAILTALCVLALLGSTPRSCPHGTRQVALLSGSQAPPDTKAPAITSVHLKRRNWENNGTDTEITKDGRFTVWAYVLGDTRKVREGSIDRKAIEKLFSMISSAELSRLPDEYKSTPADKSSWWGFELTVKADGGSKTIRYTSDNQNVPEKLRDIVATIMKLAR